MNVDTIETSRRLNILVDASSSLLTTGTYCSEVNQEVYTFGQKLKCTEDDVLSFTSARNKTLSYISSRVEKEIGSLIDISKPVENVTIPYSKNELRCAETVALNKLYIPTKWAPKQTNHDVLFFVTLSPMASRPTFIQSAVCRQTEDGRPLIGVLNISPSAFKSLGDITSESAVPAEFVDMIKHEIIHFLGFNKKTLASFIPSESDKPYIDGTLADGKTLTDMAKEHFKAEAAKVYLEVDENGTESHLKKQYFNGDIMSSGSGTVIAVSNFTTSVLSLLDYYQNPAGSVLPWGRQEASLFSEEGYKQCESGEYGCSYVPTRIGYCKSNDPLMSGCSYFAPYDNECSTASKDPLHGQSIFYGSQCFMSNLKKDSAIGTDDTFPRCHLPFCVREGDDVVLRVAVGDIADKAVVWVKCTDNAQVSVPGYGGNLICPQNTKEFCENLGTSSYAFPIVTSISPSSAHPGDTITINGQNLKPDTGSSGAMSTTATRVTVDGATCEVITATTLVVKCRLPQSFPKGQDVNPTVVVSREGFIYVDSVEMKTYFSTTYDGITVLGKDGSEWFEENLVLAIGLAIAAVCVLFLIIFFICVCVKKAKPTYKQKRSWVISTLLERQQTGTHVTKSTTESTAPPSAPYNNLAEDSGSSAVELSDRGSENSTPASSKESSSSEESASGDED